LHLTLAASFIWLAGSLDRRPFFLPPAKSLLSPEILFRAQPIRGIEMAIDAIQVPSKEMDKKAETAPETSPSAKARKCLMCRSEFTSEWSGERVCRKCKSSSVWRSA